MAYIKRGNTRMNKAEWDEAKADFMQALRLDPNSEMALVNRGLAQQNKGELELALRDYD